ncbi:MAG: GNAT family N-acetyltransferase [Candidatus Binataceae bacterium]
MVERDGAPIGRIVTARTPDTLLIVDIALIASERRRGIGASLVNGVLVEARAAGLPALGLHHQRASAASLSAPRYQADRELLHWDAAGMARPVPPRNEGVTRSGSR